MKKIILLLVIIFVNINPALAYDDYDKKKEDVQYRETSYKEECADFINYVENWKLWKIGKKIIKDFEKTASYEKEFLYRPTFYKDYTKHEPEKIYKFETGLKISDGKPRVQASLIESEKKSENWRIEAIIEPENNFEGCRFFLQFKINF